MTFAGRYNATECDGSVLTYEVKKALLARTKKVSHGTYESYQYLDEKRAALPLWRKSSHHLGVEIGDLQKFDEKSFVTRRV